MWELLQPRKIVQAKHSGIERSDGIVVVSDTTTRIGRGTTPKLPEFVVAVDVETTGLHSTDKIVSIGAVWLSTACLAERCFPVSFLHLIFDPGRKSHPEAEKVHGFDDWLLRHQDPFALYAPQISRFLSDGDVVIAHNAQFDMAFINRELLTAGQVPIDERRVACTMQGYRSAEIGGSASLRAVLEHVGLKRQGTIHGALEDAWLALMVYLWLHDYEFCVPFSQSLSCGLEMFNLRPCPPLPETGLPRRSHRRQISK
jgi:DNA polymerase III subunit epsilon